MAESSKSGRRNTGTYLYVREGHRPSDPPRGAESSAAPRVPLVTDSYLEPAGPADASRLRYVRPRLEIDALDPRLAFFLAPDAPVCDAYREAAARLMAARPDDKRVAVTAPRGGAGATLSCLNLASALAETHRVTVVDLCFDHPGVAAAFGLRPRDDLLDLVRRRHRDRRAPLDLLLVADRLALLPLANPHADAEVERRADRATLARIFEEVGQAADVVLFDVGPVLDGRLQRARGLVEAAALVVRPEDLGAGAYEQSLARLTDVAVVGTLVNSAPAAESR